MGNFNLISEGSQAGTGKHPLEDTPDFDLEGAVRQVEEDKKRISRTADNHEVPSEVIINDEYLDAIENTRNGSHFMTKEENAEYERLWYTDMKSAVKQLRERWAEHVDRDFIQSFCCIHWLSSYDMARHLEEMLGGGKHEKEISTQAYGDGEGLRTRKRWSKAKVGLLIDGRVNLAGNEDLQTNQWYNSEEDDGRKYTAYANRLMTNKENCVSPYEFVIGDWTAKAIVADPDAITPELRTLSAKYGIPIIATDDEQLFSEQNKGAGRRG